MIERARKGSRSLSACAWAAVALASGSALAQPATMSSTDTKSSPAGGMDHDAGNWPKYSLETIGNAEYARVDAADGPSRGPDARLRFDTTGLVEFNDKVSLDGLFQFKPRQPLAADDPNNQLFINQGPRRQEGGKMKELYVRAGDYRIGKFVQNFGRAYVLLPGAQAADFVEEPEQGYEPAEMIGIEKIHVFEDESHGWRQLSVSAFEVDRTFLHRSFPYDEGVIHLSDGGVGNTRWPTNLMVTWDVLRQPVGHWAQLDYQASVIRWGKTEGAERGEWWTTLGGDLSIPLHGSVEDTLRRNFEQVQLYVEAARRDNFEGTAGRTRNYLSGSTSHLKGPWRLDATTTQRWTTERAALLQRDRLNTTSLGYTLPSRAVIALSVSHETVDGGSANYAGIRVTQTFTTCNKCVSHERY